MVLSSIYVSNLAGLSHRAAIPEARRPQRLPRTDPYADASASGVLRSPLVLGVLLRLVEHPPQGMRPNATSEAAGLLRDA